MFRPLLQISQANNAEVLDTEPVEETLSILDLILSGGPGGIAIMVVLFALAIAAVYIYIERFSAIKAANKLDPNFMNNIKDKVLGGNLESATTLCESENTPVSRMIGKGIMRIGKPVADIATTVENQGKIEVARLENKLPLLATISGGAPMIGFLGTVIGMILAFKEMANAGGQVNPSMLAEGIYVAMTTTVAGLFVGILAYFGYNYLVTRVESVVYKMEVNATEFLDLLHQDA